MLIRLAAATNPAAARRAVSHHSTGRPRETMLERFACDEALTVQESGGCSPLAAASGLRCCVGWC